MNAGFGYFGHGHTHVNHDALSYDEAFQSFKTCFDIMQNYGLKPVAYAYPEGKGFKSTTQKALKNAGFICGRFHSPLDIYNHYIIPDGVQDALNWFALPSLVMRAFKYDQCDKCVNFPSDRDHPTIEVDLSTICQTMPELFWSIFSDSYGS